MLEPMGKNVYINKVLHWGLKIYCYDKIFGKYNYNISPCKDWEKNNVQFSSVPWCVIWSCGGMTDTETRGGGSIVLISPLPSRTWSGEIVFFCCLTQISFASDETRRMNSVQQLRISSRASFATRMRGMSSLIILFSAARGTLNSSSSRPSAAPDLSILIKLSEAKTTKCEKWLWRTIQSHITTLSSRHHSTHAHRHT